MTDLSAKTIEDEINYIKKEQKDNMKEINSLDKKIMALNLEQMKTEEQCNSFKENILSLDAKVQEIETHKENNENFQFTEKLKTNDVYSSIKSFECKKCEQTFDNRHSLEDHMVKIHHRKKSFQCNECGHKFLTKWRMKST